jgi:hypothetical protein
LPALLYKPLLNKPLPGFGPKVDGYRWWRNCDANALASSILARPACGPELVGYHLLND